MKTIVTGGAGFIGSHLVKRLIQEGREVVVIDDLSAGSLENLSDLGLKPSDFEFKKLDLTDYHQTSDALKEGDVVYHLAARIGGIKFLHGSESAELSALQENLAIDANVFRACAERNIKKIIYPSSSAIYSLDKQYSFGTVFSEDDFPLEPIVKDPKLRFKISINPDGGYGLVKLLAEIQLNLMHAKSARSASLRSASRNANAPMRMVGIARFFNIYGVNEPLNERAHAIADLIRKAINYPKEKFTVWGDGKQTRDYIYVSDCVEFLLKLEEKISQESPLTVNIGSGKATPIKEIVEKIIQISGKNIRPIYDIKKPVGPLSRTANINKAKTLLNWQPKISLDEGLKKTYSWIKKKLI
jgi:nucleoside-diphosphate-sugar epimerase